MRGREEGYILVIVLMFAAALFVLLAAFGPLSSANLHQAARQERETQAHYLARSGAAALASAIMEEPGLAQELLERGAPGGGDLEAGTFSVELEELSDGNVVIHSSGTARGEHSSVSLVLNKVDSDYMDHIFDRAIFCGTSLDISHPNTEIHGDVESAGKVTGDPVKGYNKIENSERVFASPLFPGDIERTDRTLRVDNNYTDTHSIKGDAYYREITVKPNGTLLVDTGTGDFSRIIRLVVEKMDCQGYLKVEGEGRLLLYLINHADLRTPHGYVDGSEGRLIVFLKDGATCQIIANSNFAGYIYGPGASVGIQSHGTVYGAVIGRHVVRMVGKEQSVHGKVFHEDIMADKDLAGYFQSKSEYAIAYWVK